MSSVKNFPDDGELFGDRYQEVCDLNDFILNEIKKGNQLDEMKIGAMYLQIVQSRLDDLSILSTAQAITAE